VIEEILDPSAASPPPPAPPEDEDADERGLFFGITAARLRSRARAASVVFLLSLVLPHDVIGSSPQFVWDIAGELSPAALLAALALPLAGLALALGLVFSKRATSLASITLASLLSVAVVRKLGADRAAWDAIALPDTLSARPVGALLCLSIIAAAANTSFRKHTARATPFLVGGALFAALYYYAWPARGEAPLTLVLRALRTFPELPGFRYQIGSAILVFLALWPLGVTVIGGGLLLRAPARKDESWLALVANWGLPFWLLLLAYRTMIANQATLALVTYLGTVLLVTAAIAVMSAALVAIVEGFVVADGDVAPLSQRDVVRAARVEGDGPVATASVRGVAPRTAALIGAAAVACLGGVQAVLARPPEKAPEWELGPPSLAAEELFGRRLLDWNAARQRWDFGGREASGAAQRLDVKSAGKTLTEDAAKVDPKVGAVFTELVDESDELDLAGRKFARLVAAVNEQNRALKLPYFVDAAVTYRDGEDGQLRHFDAYAYEIEDVRRYEVDGASRAALRVRPLGHNRDGHARLGFSRDADPYALVVLSVTDAAASDLAATAATGDCIDQAVGHMELYAGLAECGSAVSAAFAGKELDVKEGVLLGTERHELQHQIDGPHLPIATGVRSRLEGYTLDYQERVSRETSAFLAELTAEGLAPKLGLWQLAQYQLASETGTYARTALIVMEALAGRSLLHGYAVDGDAFWRAFQELFAMEDDELRARARRAWKDLFDAELAEPKLL